jgi:uncharacterized protein YecE (DUF72 family)
VQYQGFGKVDLDYLKMLAAQLANLVARARVWCVFDNTASGSAVQNALELTARIRKL